MYPATDQWFRWGGGTGRFGGGAGGTKSGKIGRFWPISGNLNSKAQNPVLKGSRGYRDPRLNHCHRPVHPAPSLIHPCIHLCYISTRPVSFLPACSWCQPGQGGIYCICNTESQVCLSLEVAPDVKGSKSSNKNKQLIIQIHGKWYFLPVILLSVYNQLISWSFWPTDFGKFPLIH